MILTYCKLHCPLRHQHIWYAGSPLFRQLQILVLTLETKCRQALGRRQGLGLTWAWWVFWHFWKTRYSQLKIKRSKRVYANWNSEESKRSRACSDNRKSDHYGKANLVQNWGDQNERKAHLILGMGVYAQPPDFEKGSKEVGKSGEKGYNDKRYEKGIKWRKTRKNREITLTFEKILNLGPKIVNLGTKGPNFGFGRTCDRSLGAWGSSQTSVAC